MIDLKTYPIPAPGAVGRMLEGEAVVVVTDQGRVKVLNEVAARIWELADGSRSVGEIADAICAEFAVRLDEAQADAATFLEKLAAEGAVTLSPTPAAGPDKGS